MKTKLIAAAAILSAAILSCTGPSAFAGKGHGGGGISSGSHGGNRGSGSVSSYSGNKGYSGGYKAYSGNLRGYTGGGLGRVYKNYPSRYSSGRVYNNYAPKYSSGYSKQYKPYSSRPNLYGGTGKKQYSSLSSAGKQGIKRSQVGSSGRNRIADVRDTRTLGKNGQTKVGTTSFANRKDITQQSGVARQNWARNNPKNTNRFDQRTQDKLRNWNGNKSSFAEAKQRHHDNHDANHDGHHHDHDGHHHHHDHDWWNHHCSTIIWVDWGWWGWWDGWWYPAWGYDPYYSYYAYDGPIYGYGGLPPDEIVSNVQSELRRRGYLYDVVDGVLGPRTQEALMRYQGDQGLPVTGGIDEETISSLGLS